MLQDLHFNWVDYGIIGIVSLSILIGMVRGFVREAMSLITWIAALTAGVVYCETAANWFSGISVVGIRLLLAFVLIVLAILVLGGIISHLIGQLIRSTKFSITDRIMGTVFGGARGAAIVAAIILVTSSTFVVNEPLWQASTLIPEFNPLSTWLKEKLPDDLMNKLFDPGKKIKGAEIPVIPAVEQVSAVEPAQVVEQVSDSVSDGVKSGYLTQSP